MLISCNCYYLEALEGLDICITPELLDFRELVGYIQSEPLPFDLEISILHDLINRISCSVFLVYLLTPMKDIYHQCSLFIFICSFIHHYCLIYSCGVGEDS